MLPHLIFDIPLVRLFHILGQVAEVDELRIMRWELSYVFDLHLLALVDGRRHVLDNWQHLIIELRSRDSATAAFVYFHRLFDAF